MERAPDDEPSPEAARLIAELRAAARRARYVAEVRTMTSLMRKGGRPPQWLPLSVIAELQRIGLVTVLGGGACKLTAAGVEAARCFEREAKAAFPDTPDRLVDAAMARVMRGERAEGAER